MDYNITSVWWFYVSIYLQGRREMLINLLCKTWKEKPIVRPDYA